VTLVGGSRILRLRARRSSPRSNRARPARRWRLGRVRGPDRS